MIHERTIQDESGKTWSVMVGRVALDGAVDDGRAWALRFRLHGDPTHRTLMQVLPDVDRPDLAAYTDDALLGILQPHAERRATEEARIKAEADDAKAAARAANAAARAAKAEAFQQAVAKRNGSQNA